LHLWRPCPYFSLLTYDGQAFIVNNWGKLRKDYPALNEFEAVCRERGYSSLKLLAEPHLVVEGKMRRLPEFLHAIKSRVDLENVHLGVWDLVELNGVKPKQPYAWRLQECVNTLNGTKRVYVLPFLVNPSREKLLAFWKEFVVEKGYEGLVLTKEEQRFRVKPVRTAECAIVGINKKQKLLNKEVTSVRMAMMTPQGDFVEVGDLGMAMERQLSRALFRLMDFKTQEEEKTIYVKPFVVVEVEFTTTYPAQQAVLRFNGTKYVKVATADFFSLREPRFKRFRQDKKAEPKDIPASQLFG
jgi:ATP-dependent DNA ligase